MSYDTTVGRSAPPGFMHQPVLAVPVELWRRLMGYVLRCPTEINGFGLIQRLNETTFFVDDVFILKQTATGSNVVTDDQAWAQKLFELTLEGREGDVKLQWHSHVDFESYFSATDLDNIDRFPGEWLISLVLNKRGELQARIDVLRPFRIWAPVDVRVWVPLDPRTITQCDADIKQFVRRRGVPFMPVGADEKPANGVLVPASQVTALDKGEGT